MSRERDEHLRRSIIAGGRRLAGLGLTPGTSGNISVRRDGCRRPSSEWRFHRDIFVSRAEIGAIVHTHSPMATALACTARAIPAFHYMVAVAGGADIRCAPYHTFGSQALSDGALEALRDRRACLLAHHGVIALGADVDAALTLAAEVEDLAVKYCAALALGEVEILSAGEMAHVVDKFRTYGRQDVPEPGLEFGGDVPPAAADSQ